MSKTVRLIANFLETVDSSTLKVPLIKGGFRGIVYADFSKIRIFRKGSSTLVGLLIAHTLVADVSTLLEVPFIKGGFRGIVYADFSKIRIIEKVARR